eukprot:6146875-Pyramimonas_sp.AAC.1
MDCPSPPDAAAVPRPSMRVFAKRALELSTPSLGPALRRGAMFCLWPPGPGAPPWGAEAAGKRLPRLL